MNHFWALGSWGRIPVSMHWTVLLAFPWLFIVMRSFIAAAIGTIAFFGLLVAHEFGHVFAARLRGLRVEEIRLFGLHGETSLGLNRTEVDEVLIAWAGVGMQTLILILAWAVYQPALEIANPWAWMLLGPIFSVLTDWNIFLIIVALLPLGPLDGPTAWKIIPMARKALRQHRRSREPPQPKLSATERKALEEQSEKAASDILSTLARKHSGSKNDELQ